MQCYKPKIHNRIGSRNPVIKAAWRIWWNSLTLQQQESIIERLHKIHKPLKCICGQCRLCKHRKHMANKRQQKYLKFNMEWEEYASTRLPL